MMEDGALREPDRTALGQNNDSKNMNSGGAANRRGGQFEDYVTALYLAELCHVRGVNPAPGIPRGASVTHVACQTASPIDDIVVTHDQGRLFVQVKRSLAIVDSDEFLRSALAQVAAQYQSEHAKGSLDNAAFAIAVEGTRVPSYLLGFFETTLHAARHNTLWGELLDMSPIEDRRRLETIFRLLGLPEDAALDVLRRLRVLGLYELRPEAEERNHAHMTLGEVSPDPAQAFEALRGIAVGMHAYSGAVRHLDVRRLLRERNVPLLERGDRFSNRERQLREFYEPRVVAKFGSLDLPSGRREFADVWIEPEFEAGRGGDDGAKSEGGPASGRETFKRRPALERLGDRLLRDRRLVLEAPALSGKTEASRAMARRCREVSGLVPIWIRFKDFSRHDVHLEQFLADQYWNWLNVSATDVARDCGLPDVELAELTRWLYASWLDGAALLILDGADEEYDPAARSRAIDRLLQSGPNADAPYVLITSRPSYDDALHGIPKLGLAEWELHQIADLTVRTARTPDEKARVATFLVGLRANSRALGLARRPGHLAQPDDLFSQMTALATRIAGRARALDEAVGQRIAERLEHAWASPFMLGNQRMQSALVAVGAARDCALAERLRSAMLARALSDASAARTLLGALARVEAPEALESMSALAADPATDDDFVEVAVAAIARVGTPPARSALLKLIRDGSWFRVQGAAARALGRCGTPDDLDEIKAIYATASQALRLMLALAWDQIVSAYRVDAISLPVVDSDGKPIERPQETEIVEQDTLLELGPRLGSFTDPSLADAVDDVRENGRGADLSHLLLLFRAAPDPFVRMAIAEHIEKRDEPEIAVVIGAMVRDRGVDSLTRIVCMKQIVGRPGSNVTQVLIDVFAVRDEAMDIRRRAAVGLEHRRDPMATPHALAVLRSPDQAPLHSMAVRILTATRCEEAAQDLLDRFFEPGVERDLRRSLADAFGEILTPAEVGPLVDYARADAPGADRELMELVVAAIHRVSDRHHVLLLLDGSIEPEP